MLNVRRSDKNWSPIASFNNENCRLLCDNCEKHHSYHIIVHFVSNVTMFRSHLNDLRSMETFKPSGAKKVIYITYFKSIIKPNVRRSATNWSPIVSFNCENCRLLCYNCKKHHSYHICNCSIYFECCRVSQSFQWSKKHRNFLTLVVLKNLVM